jgi:hypothetical protein
VGLHGSTLQFLQLAQGSAFHCIGEKLAGMLVHWMAWGRGGGGRSLGAGDVGHGLDSWLNQENHRSPAQGQ